ncbi:MAG: tetratricopeptide repeat protein [Verrucomicrobiae bacterium]|nr:tetratricopeptide repeat protein [Verrucomicrobiae bacterium]
MQRNPLDFRPWFICLALCAVTVATYWPVKSYPFINYDDPQYVTENPHVRAGLTWQGVVWAFTTGHASNWHPLTWLSLMLDAELYGDWAGGFHLTNLLLHTVNTLLLFLLIHTTTGSIWRSGVVAGLFALHPLHVESVAWVAERKDVLSTCFGLLTLLAYAGYAMRASGSVRRQRLYYWLAVALFALGLMSKPMLVTWPFVMLLLDYWPLGRLFPTSAAGAQARGKLGTRSAQTSLVVAVVEKLPFFALAFASAIVTLVAQHRGGAVQALAALPIGARIENALISYAKYLLKTVWPHDLALPYLYLPPDVWPIWHGPAAAAALTVFTLLVFKLRRRFLLMGWLWFLGTLVPVIGIVQVGNQSMADRYTYIPLIGVFIAVVWAAAELARRLPAAKLILGIGAAVILGLCVWRTRVQLAYWRDPEILFRHTIAVTKDNCVAHDILAHALLKKGKFEAAKQHFLEAVRIRLKYGNRYNAELLHNAAVAAIQQGNPAEAKEYLNQAMQIGSYPAGVPAKLGALLTAEGQLEQAIALYREALRLEPDSPDVLNNLAWLLAASPVDALRDGTEAVRLAERACELTKHKEPLLVGTLAAAYAEAGRFEEAIRTAEKARALAAAAGLTNLVARNEELLQLYRAGKAYRDQSLLPRAPAQAD